jgi:hypothetical protein
MANNVTETNLVVPDHAYYFQRRLEAWTQNASMWARYVDCDTGRQQLLKTIIVDIKSYFTQSLQVE